MQKIHQEYFYGDLDGFDPSLEAFYRRPSRIQEMAAGDAPTDENLTALGDLAAGIAHAFNDLLTAINGNCSLAFRELEPGHPVLQRLREIQAAGDSAAALTGKLLSFGEGREYHPYRTESTRTSRGLTGAA